MSGLRTPRRRWLSWGALAWGALMLVLAAACGGAGSGGGANDGGPPDERVVLVRDRRMLLRSADGAERVLFESEASNVFPAFPAWSPDGTRVAFVQSTFAVTEDGDWGDDIYVIDANGGEPRMAREHAVRGEQIQGLVWTRDGTALLAGVNTPETAANGSGTATHPNVHRVVLESGESQVLVAGAVEPSLSLDGATLAYVVPDAEGAYTIWTAAGDGSGARPVTVPENVAPPTAPRISPDGASIAFAAPANGAFSIGPRRGSAALVSAVPAVPARRATAARPAAHGAPLEIWSITLAGEELTPLTSFQEDDPRSAWLPDGSTLMVIATNGLYRVAADGSGAERVGDGAFAGQLDVR